METTRFLFASSNTFLPDDNFRIQSLALIRCLRFARCSVHQHSFLVNFVIVSNTLVVFC